MVQNTKWSGRPGLLAVETDDWSDMKSDRGLIVNGYADTAAGVLGHRPTTSEGISVGGGSNFGLCKGDADVECHVTNSNVSRLALTNSKSGETRPRGLESEAVPVLTSTSRLSDGRSGVGCDSMRCSAGVVRECLYGSAGSGEPGQEICCGVEVNPC